MEQSFWFILVGITVFILHRVWKNRSESFGWAVDTLIGSGIGIWIGFSRPMNFGLGNLPLWFTGGMGGLAAFMLWLVHRLQLLNRQALKYNIVICYSAFMLILAAQISALLSPENKFGLFIHILLVSTLSMVGYTFPARVLQTSSRKVPGM
jgi:hypothetical protein